MMLSGTVVSLILVLASASIFQTKMLSVSSAYSTVASFPFSPELLQFRQNNKISKKQKRILQNYQMPAIENDQFRFFNRSDTFRLTGKTIFRRCRLGKLRTHNPDSYRDREHKVEFFVFCTKKQNEKNKLVIQ